MTSGSGGRQQGGPAPCLRSQREEEGFASFTGRVGALGTQGTSSSAGRDRRTLGHRGRHPTPHSRTRPGSVTNQESRTRRHGR